MLFNSLQYLMFFPLTALVCYALPHRMRNAWLLLASYFFYGCFQPIYLVLLGGVTLVTYSSGRLIARCHREEKPAPYAKGTVALTVIICMALLVYFKYAAFFARNLQEIFPAVRYDDDFFTSIVLPVGISFYVFQAIGYVLDVYRKKMDAEKNLLDYALFVSFFPQLASGPIGRATSMLPQIRSRRSFSVDRTRRGLLEFCWGAFLKLLIADRLAILVNTVYGDYSAYSGCTLLIAAVCYSFQIYCDFASYSYMAVGCGRILGFDMIQNFSTPYFAVSITDFWRRWHISLSSWFRDYLYIPLGGNRKGTFRKYLNTMIVFLASGLWHGANWTYVVWGALNGLLQVVSHVLKPIRVALCHAFHCDPDNFGNRVLRVLFTFMQVTLLWVFFRAESLSQALDYIGRMVTGFQPWTLWDGSLLNLGLGMPDIVVAVMALLALLGVSLAKAAHRDVIDQLLHQGICFRYAVYLLLVFSILIFGIYGEGYDASSFIYFQF